MRAQLSVFRSLCEHLMCFCTVVFESFSMTPAQNTQMHSYTIMHLRKKMHVRTHNQGFARKAAEELYKHGKK
jgi:hypothetical protein